MAPDTLCKEFSCISVPASQINLKLFDTFLIFNYHKPNFREAKCWLKEDFIRGKKRNFKESSDAQIMIRRNRLLWVNEFKPKKPGYELTPLTTKKSVSAKMSCYREYPQFPPLSLHSSIIDQPLGHWKMCDNNSE